MHHSKERNSVVQKQHLDFISTCICTLFLPLKDLGRHMNRYEYMGADAEHTKKLKYFNFE
jgi:hypothetical protein